MRSIVIIILTFICSALIHANEINISTTTKNGNTIFYLQAGAFNLEKDAKQREKELSGLVSEHVTIKNLSDKKLYLVQIGPISDYLKARDLQNKLTQQISAQKNQKNNEQNQTPPSVQTNQSENSSEPTETLPPNSQIWNLRNADIRAVIAEVSRVTGKNFVIDPRVQGKISIPFCKYRAMLPYPVVQ